jgi:hypothetical protein
MKKHFIALVALLAGAGFAQTPVFDPPVAIQARGADINVGYGGNASPFVAFAYLQADGADISLSSG